MTKALVFLYLTFVIIWPPWSLWLRPLTNLFQKPKRWVVKVTTFVFFQASCKNATWEFCISHSTCLFDIGCDAVSRLSKKSCHFWLFHVVPQLSYGHEQKSNFMHLHDCLNAANTLRAQSLWVESDAKSKTDQNPDKFDVSILAPCPPANSVTGSNWIIVVFAFIAQCSCLSVGLTPSSITWKEVKRNVWQVFLGGSSIPAYLHYSEFFHVSQTNVVLIPLESRSTLSK